jgi:hypothetical protein
MVKSAEERRAYFSDLLKNQFTPQELPTVVQSEGRSSPLKPSSRTVQEWPFLQKTWIGSVSLR